MTAFLTGSSPFEIPLKNYCFKRHTIKVSGYCDRTEVDSLSGNFRGTYVCLHANAPHTQAHTHTYTQRE